MEAKEMLYKTTRCKECDMLFFEKPASLNQFCGSCDEKGKSDYYGKNN